MILGTRYTGALLGPYLIRRAEEKTNTLAILLVVVWLIVFSSPVSAQDVLIPSGTRVYLELTDSLIGTKESKGGNVSVGKIVNARVWRDVVVDGQVVIRAGTPATLKVSRFKRNKMFGRQGLIILQAISTSTVDEQTIPLHGGYDKTGKSRKGVAIGVGVVVAWPVLFLKGKAATLPAGTIVETAINRRVRVATAGGSKIQTVDLSDSRLALDVDVLYERLRSDDKPDFFEFRIATSQPVETFFIDSINDETLEKSLELTISRGPEKENGRWSSEAKIEIKELAKRFDPGINRFDVACKVDGNRVATEVILNITF